MSESPTAKAIRLAGGVAATARAIGVSQPFASQMKRGVRAIPARHVLPLERACMCAVTRHELRPDIFGQAPEVTP